MAMALTRFFFATSMLLLSLLVIAAAGDYGYAPKPDFGKPKPEEKEKLTPKPDIEKPKPTGDYGYAPKTNHEKPIAGEKEMLFPKPYIYKPKPEENEKLIPKPDLYKPTSEKNGKLLPVGCEGLVLCKSGTNYVPIKGAVAKVTCLTVNDQGYETAPSTYSCETDEKGYFFMPLSYKELDNKSKLTKCTAFLEKSPLETCKVPTNVNKGISGASFSSYRILNDKNMKLYSVGPFFYTSESKSTPTGY